MSLGVKRIPGRTGLAYLAGSVRRWLICCVALGKFLPLPGPQFSSLHSVDVAGLHRFSISCCFYLLGPRGFPAEPLWGLGPGGGGGWSGSTLARSYGAGGILKCWRVSLHFRLFPLSTKSACSRKCSLEVWGKGCSHQGLGWAQS